MIYSLENVFPPRRDGRMLLEMMQGYLVIPDVAMNNETLSQKMIT
jgi:hypothetical protein